MIATVASALGGIALGLVTRETRTPRDAEAVAGTPVAVRSPSNLSAEPVDIDPDWRPDLTAAIDAVADERAVKELAEEIWAGAPGSVQRDEWLMALIARWVDLKGAAGIEMMERWDGWSNEDLHSQIVTLKGFAMHRLALRDLDAALALSFDQRSNDGPQWGALILDKYPERLAELFEAKKFSGSDADWSRAGQMLAQGGWKNAELIESGLNNAFSGMTYKSAFDGFVAEMAATDPDGAIKWAGEIDARKVRFRSDIVGQAGGRPDDLVRAAVIKQLVESDMERAKALAMEWKEDKAPRLLVAKAIAESDLEAAAAWLDVDGEGFSWSLLPALVPALEKRSTAEVISFFEHHPTKYSSGFSVAFLENKSPAEAAQLADELVAMPASTARDTMLAGALRIAANGDPETGLQRALQLAQSEGLPAIALHMPQALARDPALLMDFAALVPVENQVGFFRGVANGTTRNDLRALAEVIDADLDAPLAKVAAQTLVSSWAQDGLRAPSEWLRSLPDGAPRDAGIGVLVSRLRELEPDSALIWAQEIGDGDRRIEALETTLRPWVAIDAEGAAAAVAELELSDVERHRLQEFIANPDGQPQP